MRDKALVPTRLGDSLMVETLDSAPLASPVGCRGRWPVQVPPGAEDQLGVRSKRFHKVPHHDAQHRALLRLQR